MSLANQGSGGSRLRSAGGYLYELDTLRGLAIVAVVAVHGTLPLMEQSGLGGWNHLWAILINQLGRFSVPAFLFISGLLITYRQANRAAAAPASPRPWAAMLRRRATGILVPYAFWVLAGLLTTDWRTELIQGRGEAFQELGRALLLGENPYYHLYFVPLIFQMYLLAPLVSACLGPEGAWRRRQATLMGAMLVQLLVVVAYELVLDGWVRLPPEWMPTFRTLVRLTFPAWIGYFVAGMVVGGQYAPFGAWLDRLPGSGLLAAWVGSLVLLLFDYASAVAGAEAPSGGSADFMRVAVVLFASLSVLLFLRQARRWYQAWPGTVRSPAAEAAPGPVRLLSLVGQYSFGVYLVHLFVLRSLGGLGAALQQSWVGATGLSLLVLALSVALAAGLGRLPLGWVVAGRPTRRPRPAS